MEVRPVGIEHLPQLEGFSCAVVGEAHSLEVEVEIRSCLGGELTKGRIEVLGAWDGQTLAAIVAFIRSPLRSVPWRITVLATDHRYRRRKQALRLKREVMRRAAEAGVDFVQSSVHPENWAMRALNDKLGGRVSPAPDPADDRLICTVDTRRIRRR